MPLEIRAVSVSRLTISVALCGVLWGDWEIGRSWTSAKETLISVFVHVLSAGAKAYAGIGGGGGGWALGCIPMNFFDFANIP